MWIYSGKKLALPGGPGVTSTLGYSMSHPSLLKSNWLPFPTTITIDGNENSTAGTCVEEDVLILTEDRAISKDQELTGNKSYGTENDQTL